MEWKKIVKVILRILWMLRLVTPREGEGLKGSKSSKVRKDASPNKKKDEMDDKPPAQGKSLKGLISLISLKGLKDQKEDNPGQATPQTPQTIQTPQTPQATMRSASDVIAAEHVGATYSSNCSKLLPRSQVLYSLQWDLRHSARKINLLVLHCSDTRPDQDFTIEKLMHSHRAKGYGNYPGYHLYVRRDGTLFYCRPVAERGCHVKGYNANSIGICYEGGHSCSPDVKYEDNRTAEQMVAIDEVLRILHEIYPDARIVGHCELNPRKACPCLDPPASVEYQYIYNT